MEEDEEEVPDPDELVKMTDEDDIYSLNPIYILKFLYLCHEDKTNKLFKPSFSKETNNLLRYFSNKKVELKLEENQIDEKSIKNRKIIGHLEDLIKKFKSSKINQIESIINEIKKSIEDLKYKEFILIPFIGPTNAGKSTIINGIIGEEILPTNLRECTKRGILIRYAKEDENDITIRKAFLTKGRFSDKISYIKEGDPIGKGIDNVRQTLKSLNYGFNQNEKDSFYCIGTKIKLFDDLQLSDHYKKMIYLIDLPGYGTRNIFETQIYKKIISICNAFIFVVRNSVIKENDTKEY